MNTVAKIEKLQRQSVLAWEMAVETAGPEYAGGSEGKAEAMQSLADECDEAYDAAIAALESGDIDAARTALETAKSLESEGGDASHAISALEVLR